MMTVRVVCLFWMVVTQVVGKLPPDGYIMNIATDCGTNTSSIANVHVATDLNADIKAVCAGGVHVNFTTDNTVDFYLPISYPGQTPQQDCVFKKRLGAEVYAIRVILSYGEKDKEVHDDQKIRTITCTFDVKGQVISSLQEVNGSLIAPNEVQVNKGSITLSNLSLMITDVNGNLFNSDSIDMGRTVKLVGETTGESGELGLRIVSCDAIAVLSNRRYQIIRAGCGDGVIFDQHAGFTTTSLTAESPYFEMFGLWTDRILIFECNFTLCEERCDGSSCASERKRRGALFSELSSDLIRTIPLTSSLNENGDENIVLELRTVGGYPLKNETGHRERYRLYVESKGGEGEKGIRVDSCDFVSTKRTQEPLTMEFIKNGCEVDPDLWVDEGKPNRGFTTDGLTAMSDPFFFFCFYGDCNLNFECNIVLCMDAKCDGSSCVGNLMKRSAASEDNIVGSTYLIRTSPHEVKINGQYSRIKDTDVIKH